MESENHNAVAAASNELSRVMHEHLGDTAAVIADLIEHAENEPAAGPHRIGDGIRLEELPVLRFDSYALTDHGSSADESATRLAMGLQPLTPPADIE